ncbi:hypothetical protein [Hymenobacter latericus]|uniref:hypothetical protein n=1 Tax=Hymenobacter sp. YIM 151858-1 TaxID=2987688 RepID=UPI002226B22B|nr:hypothetical protein [Hymenobacter sp. YIM 151858-1]UYZ59597.1 hypothetical protein OIS50_02090 [Hymenobacter sp. YIM 151858-1]
MIRLYTLISLVLLPIAALAQGLPGYVLKLSGDTVRGTITERRGQVYLRQANAATPQRVGPSQVKAYAVGANAPIHSSVVRLASGADSVWFVLPQLIGPASLYMDASQSGMLLRPAANDTLYELSPSNWHVLFNRYLTGCATLKQTDARVLELPYSPENVRRVLTEYNTCVDREWRLRQPSVSSAWQEGFAVRATGLFGLLGNKGQTNLLPQVGFEWTGLRASGLYASLQLDYSYLSAYSGVTRTTNNFNAPVEQREYSRAGMAAATTALGKRWGQPQRVGLHAGAGMGLSFMAHQFNEVQQRPAGSAGPFRVAESYHGGRGVAAHLDLTAGVHLPLGAQRELRLQGWYRNLLLTGLSFAGVQVGYHWLR